MSVSFLKTDTESALKVLREAANTGFQLYDQIQADRTTVISITGVEIDRWTKLNAAWTILTLHKLEKVLEPQELFRYKNPEMSPIVRIGENPDYQNIMKSIESRSMYIKELGDRIMSKSDIYINAKGDAFIQTGSGSRQEVKKNE